MTANPVPPLAPTSSLSDVVRGVADDLVRDLRAAEAVSAGWADPDDTDRHVHSLLQRSLDRLAATGCWGEASRLPSGELWRIAGEWLARGSLQLHARTKPRGYAGDFEMFLRIWAGELCDDRLGASFDRFFQSQAAPRAVRHRTRMIADEIVATLRQRDGWPVHIASVGSGPGLDVQLAAEQLAADERRRLSVTLLDFDPVALDHARMRLMPVLDTARFRCVRENLFRLAQAGRAAAVLTDVDLLLCPGLFDYLDDEAAAAMLARFAAALRPGGRAWVFNFAPHNPSRAYMEWIGNWYLTYRTADEMLALAARPGLPDVQAAVANEPTGVNLFWMLTKAA